MEKPSPNISALLGDLAKTLKSCKLPQIQPKPPKFKPSIVIDEKYLELAKSNQSNSETAEQKPPSEVQSDSLGYDAESDSSLYEPEFDTLDYEPESLLKLLSDDYEVPESVIGTTVPDNADPSNNSQENSKVQTQAQGNTPTQGNPPLQENPPPQPTEPVMVPALIMPEYLRVPATFFPLVIGTESYLLPYMEDNVRMIVALQVVQAAGKFVVCKVVGCNAPQPDVVYPDILLTRNDEIKLAKSKVPQQMTIDEQLEFKKRKAKDNKKVDKQLNKQIQKFNIQQQKRLFRQAEAREKTARQREARLSAWAQTSRYIVPSKHRARSPPQIFPPQPDEQGDTAPEPTSQQSEEKYLKISGGLVGTVVKIPTIEEPSGLISYEINETFATVPFFSMPIRMVGGETVEFDLDMNCEMKKCEAVRIRLAPLNASLNNTEPGAKKKRNMTIRAADLLLAKSPPTCFYRDRIMKLGLQGVIHILPSAERAGVLHFLLGKTLAPADFEFETNYETDDVEYAVGSVVQFDLTVWFDTVNPSEATNLKLTKETGLATRYSVVDFICEELPDERQWTVEEFRQLLLEMKRGRGEEHFWRALSARLRRPQIYIKNFLKVFITNIKKATNPTDSNEYRLEDLDEFINGITSRRPRIVLKDPETVTTRARQSSAKENNQKPKAKAKPGRKTCTKKKNVVAKATEQKNPPKENGQKRVKVSPAPAAASAESISQIVAALSEPVFPPNFTSRQTFVAKNLHHWKQVQEVPGERTVNGVLGDVMHSCAEHVTTGNEEGVDYAVIYRYLGALLEGKAELPALSVSESRVVLYLLQDLHDDIAKRNLHTHKQFLLQRFFDFTSSKNNARTPINPYKLKGFLLHLPDARPSLAAD